MTTIRTYHKRKVNTQWRATLHCIILVALFAVAPATTWALNDAAHPDIDLAYGNHKPLPTLRVRVAMIVSNANMLGSGTGGLLNVNVPLQRSNDSVEMAADKITVEPRGHWSSYANGTNTHMSKSSINSLLGNARTCTDGIWAKMHAAMTHTLSDGNCDSYCEANNRYKQAADFVRSHLSVQDAAPNVSFALPSPGTHSYTYKYATGTTSEDMIGSGNGYAFFCIYDVQKP
ncbi:hypothetical protein DQZ30_02400 [Salmonella enterica subsp. diarizonae]|nr:hypothetical protein [Salmonella enterica subsp. diarizonae]